MTKYKHLPYRSKTPDSRSRHTPSHTDDRQTIPTKNPRSGYSILNIIINFTSHQNVKVFTRNSYNSALSLHVPLRITGRLSSHRNLYSSFSVENSILSGYEPKCNVYVCISIPCPIHPRNNVNLTTSFTFNNGCV